METAVVAAIAIVVAAAFITLTQAARPYAMRSAATQFDAALSYATAVAASSGNGATLVFDRRLGADGAALSGFILRIYSGRPTASGALQQAGIAAMQSSGDVTESQLGGVPFTVFLDSAGHASGMRGSAASGTPPAGDPGCPPSESSLHLTFSDPRASQTRTLPCDLPVSGPAAAVSPVP